MRGASAGLDGDAEGLRPTDLTITSACEISFGGTIPQSGLEGLALSNTGEGTKRSPRLSGEVKGVKYEYAGGSSCATPEVRTDGVIKGETTLAASNAKAEQIGAYLTGYEVP